MSIAAVQFHPDALEEAEAARDWYSRRSIRAAEMFLDALDAAIIAIRSNPGRFAEYLWNTRRMILHRFPYFIVFRAASSRVEIIAIAHGHRRPGYWRDRAG